MRNKYLTIIALTSLIGIQACQKEEEEPRPTDNPPPLQNLVRSIEWDYGTVAHVNYNADSTIHDISYANPGSGGMLAFDWSGKKVMTQSYDPSLYKSTYQYQNDRLTTMIISNKMGSSPVTHQFDYSYKTNGSLNELKYFKTDEAGKKLQAVTRYEYNSQGELTTVTTTQQPNNSVIKYAIEAWSAECEINTWLYISPTLTEYYALYNYPLLSKFTKLPARTVKSTQQTGRTVQVEKIEDAVYTITNKRLDKTVTTLTYPQYPDLDQTQTTTYKY